MFGSFLFTKALYPAKAGTVKIDVSPITFTNAGNVNPGDNDPTISHDAHSGTTPVSYTHLDVYKRQANIIPKGGIKLCRQNCILK